MPTAELCPYEVCLQPELAALVILDAALMASRAALIAQHPDAGHLGLYSAQPLPSLTILAALLVERTDELRSLLCRYRRALDDFHAELQNRHAKLPF